MSDNEHATSTEKTVGHVINLILGAIVLWVGQTAVKHTGELSGMNQRLHYVQKRQDLFQTELVRRTDSRFTADDGQRHETRMDTLKQNVADLQSKVLVHTSHLSESDAECKKIVKLQQEVTDIKTRLACDEVKLAELLRLRDFDYRRETAADKAPSLVSGL